MHWSVVPLVILLAAPNLDDGGESRTLTGEYMSKKTEGRRRLEAIFKPTSKDGTGRVQDENHLHKLIFHGEFEGGRFLGTHAEITGDHSVPTGTLTLREAAIASQPPAPPR